MDRAESMQTDFHGRENEGLNDGHFANALTTTPDNRESSQRDKPDPVYERNGRDRSSDGIKRERSLLTDVSIRSTEVLNDATLTPQHVLSATTEKTEVQQLQRHEGMATRKELTKRAAHRAQSQHVHGTTRENIPAAHHLTKPS